MDRKTEQILKKVSKPGRYAGGEFGSVIKDRAQMKARIAFCFPDSYEIGMSNLGVRILAGVLNEADDVWCERAYAPWPDMEEEMRKNGIPLFAAESRDPLSVFDFVAFTLQYELCYSNVLNMLDLAGIPLLAADRGERDPILLGGGPCAYNAEPVADFFDIFSIGEGEEALPELVRLYINMKEDGSYTRAAFLRRAACLEGFYVPSLYHVTYHDDGTVAAITPESPDLPARIRKRIVQDLNTSYYPDKPVMPYIETVHDRIMVEAARGCIRGCRFCQAGMIFRPVREKSPDTIDCQARTLYQNTGYDEISLTSLSISDHSQLEELTEKLLSWTDEKKISLSLPSLRADSFSRELMERISSVRTSGLTFAPEAGTQRLRDAINKNVTEEDVMHACSVAFEGGKNQVKLYFMMGLPTETYEDLDGIAALAAKVVDCYYHTPNRPRRPPTVTISVACFIPKPFTPFQWEAQDPIETLREKQKYLASKITDKKIRYNWHNADVSRLEAVFARGDRRLSRVLIEAHRRGIKFDSWDEFFRPDLWEESFAAAGVDPAFYLREIGEDEILPWDMIDCGVCRDFLLRERARSRQNVTTRNCREQCSACGANAWGGEGTCCPNRKA